MNNTKAEAVARLEDIITSHGYDFERDMEELSLVRVYNYDYHYEVSMQVFDQGGYSDGSRHSLSARLAFTASEPDEECLGAAFHDVRQMARLVQAVNREAIAFDESE